MEVKVSQYQFNRIGSQMEREYGKIRKGEEDAHMMLLFPMEAPGASGIQWTQGNRGNCDHTVSDTELSVG